MDAKVIKKAGNDVDPITQTMMDFQKSDPQMYNQLFAATSLKFHQFNGSAPSSHVNKEGYVRYIGDLSDEFNNIIGQFTNKEGKVDRTKAALMIKKYSTGTIRNQADYNKAMRAYQQKYDVSPKYFNKSLSPAENKLKNDDSAAFRIMGTVGMYNHQDGVDFIKKKEEEAKQSFIDKGGVLPKGNNNIKRIR